MQETVEENVGLALKGQKRQFSTFWLSGRLFGVDILDVKEINRELKFTPIFHTPREVKGYVNIRGQIHLVLDLRLLLGFETKELDDNSCMVIFKQTVAEPFGVLVDKIGDVVEVDENDIEDRMESDESVSRDMDSLADINSFIGGVCKMQDNLLVILKARSFFKAIAVEKH